MSDLGDARAALLAISRFAGWGEAPITRLGGLTNRVFKVEGAEIVCLRLPGARTEEYIDRSNEANAARRAAAAGVGPRVIYANPATGVLVTQFVAGAATMSPARFRSHPGAPRRAGEAFRKLHESGAQFSFRFELFSMIDDYLKLLSTKTVELPEGYNDALDEAETVRAALAAHKLPLTACHCDPMCENFLDTGERMWIVDWEYSGMNDPMWDLGDLSVEAGFGAAQDEAMIAGYFSSPPRPDEVGRFVIYKAMCDLLWTLWGLIQHANNNPADDFAAYARYRFARCKRLMAEPDFATHVSTVAAGSK
ncbi:MAG: phosphotransferase [Cucumibacter sp.]